MKASDALRSLRRLLARTPVRTFVIYPLGVIAVELTIRRGRPVIVPWGALLLAWGYLQYRVAGTYRVHHGGGGPGITVPPERLVVDGLNAYTRNPMYLGHLIFMLGLAVTFWSWPAIDPARRERGLVPPPRPRRRSAPARTVRDAVHRLSGAREAMDSGIAVTGRVTRY